MSLPGPAVRLGKCRRTSRKLLAMVEDNDLALDTVMYQLEDCHPERPRVLVPVWLDRPQNSGQTASELGPDAEPKPSSNNIPAPNVNMYDNPTESPTGQSNHQWFYYMKEFVSKIALFACQRRFAGIWIMLAMCSFSW